MGFGTRIERMDDRMDAVEAALRTALPARVVKRSYWRHYDDHGPGELEQGVIMLISGGEEGYSRNFGMAAREGTHRMLLVGHLRVAETDAPQAIEAAELDLIEELKAFVRGGVAGMDVQLDSVQHSRQQAHPYGWVVAYLDVGPPRQTTH